MKTTVNATHLALALVLIGLRPAIALAPHAARRETKRARRTR